MTPQKATMDSMNTPFAFFVSYHRFSPKFPVSLSAAALCMYLCGFAGLVRTSPWAPSPSAYVGYSTVLHCTEPLAEYICYCKRAILFPPPATKAGVHTRQAERGMGGSIFWKKREIGLPSYSKICTLFFLLFLRT